MIKLSLFMTDPLAAHEKYQKEMRDYDERAKEIYKDTIQQLERKVLRLQKENEGLRKGMSKISQKNNQQRMQLKALREKEDKP